jgi:hypothetical protein
MKFQDLTDKKMYMLTFRKFVGKNKNGQAIWLCDCDCGISKEIAAHHIKSGNIKSCGCLNTGEARAKASTRHGMSYTVEWNSYHSCKKRCKPENAGRYPDHAGKGIQFRFSSFEEFYAELGPRPEPKFDYSVDRWPNPYGHYEKGNVRWATKEQQALNRACEWCMARNDVLKLSRPLAEIPLTKIAS